MLTIQSLDFICRDEEKKMGTLVKEEFGRPNRENTMVMFLRIHHKISLSSPCVANIFVYFNVGNAPWVL